MNDMTAERIEQIRERVANVSGQTWQAWNMVHAETGKPMMPDELGEYVKNCVIKSIEDGGSTDQFLFISFDGEGNPDICHVGNGPNRAANAAFIAHARQDIPDLLSALAAANERAERAEAERARLRQSLAEHEFEALKDSQRQNELSKALRDLPAFNRQTSESKS